MQEYVPYVIIGVVAALLIATTVITARIVWRRQVRRYIVALTGYREALVSALKTADATLGSLAGGTVEQVLSFAGEDSEERRVLAEIAARMRIENSELREIALPKKLWPLADMLCDAARILADACGTVGDVHGEAALDALLALDLGPARLRLGEAAAEIERVSVIYDLTDPSVYGGGLYI